MATGRMILGISSDGSALPLGWLRTGSPVAATAVAAAGIAAPCRELVVGGGRRRRVPTSGAGPLLPAISGWASGGGPASSAGTAGAGGTAAGPAELEQDSAALQIVALELGTVAVALGALTLVLGALAVALGTVAVALGALTLVLGALAVALGTVAVALGALTMVLGALAVALGALAVALGAVALHAVEAQVALLRGMLLQVAPEQAVQAVQAPPHGASQRASASAELDEAAAIDRGLGGVAQAATSPRGQGCKGGLLGALSSRRVRGLWVLAATLSAVGGLGFGCSHVCEPPLLPVASL